jgi:hypothetical protein
VLLGGRRHEDGVGTVLARDRAAFRSRFGQRFSNSPETPGEILNRIRVGDYVVDEESVTGVQGSDGESERIH